MTNTDTIKLEIRKYPKLIENFAKENFNLKSLIASLLILLMMNTLVTVYLLKQGPEVVALNSDGARTQVETKITDLQVQAAIRDYISYRYVWTPENVKEQIKKAEFFVEPSLLSAFRNSMVPVQKYILDKKVSQRVYPKKISVDMKNQTVSLILDRITEFEQLKAATEMQLVLNFSIGDRTVVNPWRVYINKETEKVGRNE